MKSCGNNRILSLCIAAMLTTTTVLAMPLTALAATFTTSTWQELQQAMFHAEDGDTILIGDDIEIGALNFRTKNLTVDTGNHTVNVTSRLGLTIGTGSLTLTGSGELNAVGGANINGGTGTITSAQGGVTAKGEGASLTILRDITNTPSPIDYGVTARDSARVEVGGDLFSASLGVYCVGDNSYVSVGRDIVTTSSSGGSSAGIITSGTGATVIVQGNVAAQGTAVRAESGARAVIAGDVTRSEAGSSHVNGYGAYASKGTIEIGGDVTGLDSAVRAVGGSSLTPAVVTVGGDAVSIGIAPASSTSQVAYSGVYASQYGNASVEGNAKGYNYGIFSQNNAVVTVGGDARAENDSGTDTAGVLARHSGRVHVRGNVYSPVQGIHAYSKGTVEIDGDVHGGLYGIYASEANEITVGGNVYSDDASGAAVDATSTGLITIRGDVQAANRGVRVNKGAEVIVEGEIVAPLYITIGGRLFNEEDRTVPTTKEGYHTYTDGTSSVWVKAIEVIPVTGVSINETEATLPVGETLQLIATVEPENATSPDVIWSSEDSSIADVDENTGVVTAVSRGQTAITVTTLDGEFTAECVVKVIEIDKPVVYPGTLDLKVDESKALTIYMGQDQNQAETAVINGYDNDIIDISEDEVVGEGPHTVTVTGKTQGSTTISLGWSGGAMHGETRKIAVRVVGDHSNPDPEEPNPEEPETPDNPNPEQPETWKPGYGHSGNSGYTGGSYAGSGGGSRKASGSGSSGRRGGATGADYTDAGQSGIGIYVGTDGGILSSILTELNHILSSGNGPTSIRVRNARHISASLLRSMANAAGQANRPLTLYADTVSSDGAFVQGRLYVEPARMTGVQESLNLGVYTEAAKTAARQATFAGWYSNDIVVVSCEQQGSFGTEIHIAAKADLSHLDADALNFYFYDRSANTCTPIDKPHYKLDSKGYLHFYTNQGGDIIISNGPLERR